MNGSRGMDWALDARTSSGLRYATSLRNTTVMFSRLGTLADDTWKVTVYRDGCPASFTTHGENAAAMLDGLVLDGFNRYAQHGEGRALEAWCI